MKRNFDCKYVAKIAGVTVVSSASSYVVLALLAIPHRYLSQNSANIVNNYAVPALLSIPPKYLSQNFINMMNNYAGSRIVTDKIMGGILNIIVCDLVLLVLFWNADRIKNFIQVKTSDRTMLENSEKIDLILACVGGFTAALFARGIADIEVSSVGGNFSSLCSSAIKKCTSLDLSKEMACTAVITTLMMAALIAYTYIDHVSQEKK